MRTSHGRRLSARLKRAERINKAKEIGVERKRETKVRREKEPERQSENGRKTERANEKRTVYLATGGTYRSICAQPLSTQPAYVDT